LHRYLYADQSPINFNDPSGEIVSLAEFGTLLSVRTILQTIAINGFILYNLIPGKHTGADVTLGSEPSEKEKEEFKDIPGIRIQFQTTESGKTRNYSRAAHNVDGVLKVEAIQLLYSLYYNLPTWWGREVGRWTAEQVQILEMKIYSTTGVGPGFEYFYRQSKDFNYTNYRIDMENLRGYNLRF
jgi:hypothetical protein